MSGNLISNNVYWKGGPESIRQNQLFKDFFYLAEYPTTKQRCLYVLGSEFPEKFLSGGRAIASVLSKDVSLQRKFHARYGDRFSRVNEFVQYCNGKVRLIDLVRELPDLWGYADEEV